MQNYKIGLWSMNMGFAPASVQAFADHIERRMEDTASAGGRLLVMPEYAVEAALSLKTEGLKPTEEMAFLCHVGHSLKTAVRHLPEQTGVSLLLGSMPVKRQAGFTNTALLLTSDGREISQDKLCLTPGEADPDSWTLVPGTELQVFDLDGIKTAILICLDVEMPALSSLLAKADIELLLVPSMTERLAGYHRVYGCAKARAVELMCAVAVCGTVGPAKGTTQNETNVSGAALYLPCEEELGHAGIGIDLPPTGGTHAYEHFSVASVPIDTLRKLKAGEAEVWPGAWTADHVRLTKNYQ
ncbi:putative amidohydrolase [Roseibium hamelinense]|uniref:Putative amidohydrolase n=1 Tax=Roseibium hamelinense TaxID=150831 RepID=A0A562TGG9_9HYPH|nr:nitrilase-related carbon-nitrogen hydrolase [Roseibium hamelinense]MTI46125.1 nitrilase [Roseibium hamelinense]TWI92682.1 putative amidohydrolase [Roseibium hamelinense]